MQSSMQALLATLSFVVSLAFPDPLQFFWLILMSLAAVSLATALTLVYTAREWVRAAIRAAEVGADGDGDAAAQREALLPGGAEEEQ